MQSKGSLTTEEYRFLEEAVGFLEKPGVFIRIAALLGQPVEFVQNKLPGKAKELVRTATQKSLEKALGVAIKTLPASGQSSSFLESEDCAARSNRMHILGAGMTGALGGLFGLASLPFELPVTTTLMLRSIAQNAQTFGADLKLAETQLECLYVFTLGSPNTNVDDASETSYYASRFGLAQMLTQAASFVANKTSAEVLRALQHGTAPPLVRFLASIASKFEIAVTEKVISEALPIIGAAGGAAINTAFMNYFNEAAKYHFGLRNLERKYGEAEIRNLYSSIARTK